MKYSFKLIKHFNILKLSTILEICCNQRVWKPLRPNFSANSRYFHGSVRHLGSAILNVSDLNSDSYSASMKTQGIKFLRQISFFIIFLHHLKSAILNLRDLTSIVVQELLTNDFSRIATQYSTIHFKKQYKTVSVHFLNVTQSFTLFKPLFWKY